VSPGLADYLLIGAIAAAVTAAVTPVVRSIAPRVGWVVQPNDRSVHTSPIPHVGGLAMLAGFVAAFVTAWALGSFDAIFDDNSEPMGILLAAIVVFATGFLDDIKDMAPPGKVTGVVIAGIILSQFGATMFYFRVPFLDVLILSTDWTPLVTVLWLLGMTQAINLIDGLDGLAAGIVAIAAIAFFLYASKLNDLDLLLQPNLGPLMAIITAGICLGFLPYNFNPARIFMGDSGAFLLGMLLAVSTSVVGGRAAPNTQDFVGQTFFFFAPLAIPLLILGVPILDTLFAIIRRASRRQAIDVADKGHLHHRLMNLGHGHRRSVLILWAWTALLSGFVLYPVLTERTRPTSRSASVRSGSSCTPCSTRASAGSGPRRSKRRSTGLRPSSSTRRDRSVARPSCRASAPQRPAVTAAIDDDLRSDLRTDAPELLDDDANG
jgi:UDP-GlcNAc:undecaprenyl-phosphate/decaprenyl-phosphate GlcNAc-1-phosphate transferase